jgi:hypothetical protein
MRILSYIISIFLICSVNVYAIDWTFNEAFTNDDDWTQIGLHSNYFISNGMLTSNTGDIGGRCAVYDNYKPDSNAHTFVIRCKAGQKDHDTPLVILGYDDNDTAEWSLYFRDNKSGITGVQLVGSTNEYVSYDNTQWAIFRVTWDGTTVNLYKDEYPVPVATSGGRGKSGSFGIQVRFDNLTTEAPVVDYMYCIDGVVIPPRNIKQSLIQ